EIGGFDPRFSPGSRFPSSDDRDIAMPARRYHVYETSTIAVKHFGFRIWQQGLQLTRRDFLAISAAYSKFLKCGRIELIYIPAFVKGFIEGLRTPLDKATMLFVDGQREPPRVCRRPLGLSYAAMADCSSMA